MTSSSSRWSSRCRSRPACQGAAALQRIEGPADGRAAADVSGLRDLDAPAREIGADAGAEHVGQGAVTQLMWVHVDEQFEIWSDGAAGRRQWPRPARR